MGRHILHCSSSRTRRRGLVAGRVVGVALDRPDRASSASCLDRTQSTIARFERGEGWPQDPDIAITAYADDLDMDPIELWELALERWRQEGRQPKLVDLKQRRGGEIEERRAKRAAGGRRSAPADEDRVDPLDELGREPTAPEQPRTAESRKRTRRPKR